MNIRNTVYSLFIWMIILSALVIMCYQLIKRLFPNLLIFEEVNDVVVREEDRLPAHNIIIQRIHMEEEIQMENIAGEEVIIR